jgi:hypothetical protein
MKDQIKQAQAERYEIHLERFIRSIHPRKKRKYEVV